MLVTTHEYGKLRNSSEFDGQAHFFRNLFELIWLAEAAAEDLTDSYRVNVAAVLSATNVDEQTIGTIVNGNEKPYSAVRKRCAEKKGLHEARSLGFTTINGLVVKGPHDLDVIGSINPTLAPTLHCCDECLNALMLYHDDEDFILPGDTPVVTTTGLNGITQIHSLDEMLTYNGIKILNPVEPPDHAIKNIGALDWQRAHAKYNEMTEAAVYEFPGSQPSPVALMRDSLAAVA